GSKDLKPFTVPDADKIMIYPYTLNQDQEPILASLEEIKKVDSRVYDLINDNEERLRIRPSLKTASDRKDDIKKFKEKFKLDEDGKPIWHYLQDDYYKYV